MYEWIKDIDDVICNLHKELNDNETRVKITKKVIDILKNHNIDAFVDCSSKINTPEVVNNADFHLFIRVDGIDMLFKYQKRK